MGNSQVVGRVLQSLEVPPTLGKHAWNMLPEQMFWRTFAPTKRNGLSRSFLPDVCWTSTLVEGPCSYYLLLNKKYLKGISFAFLALCTCGCDRCQYENTAYGQSAT